jgi:L-aminopeptidase/D-esterase-like protein
MRTGPRNLITDVAGLSVGCAHDPRLRSGATVVVFDAPAPAAVDVRGGAPGTRETDLLALENTVGEIDALVLSGGSVFGLDAASGVVAGLRAQGRGFAVGDARAPIVPAAILFDLTNGGDKDWGLHAPYRELGLAAFEAAGLDFPLGSSGAGFGARTGAMAGPALRGGLGSASVVDDASGAVVGALAAVNALGSAVAGQGPRFWAGSFEIGDEFGGLGPPTAADGAPLNDSPGRGEGESTTLCVVATDAALTRPELKRLAVMAQDGLARALWPAPTPLDGDIVFAAATGRADPAAPRPELARLGALAAAALARAVARGVHSAESAAAAPGAPKAWRDLFGG